MSLSVPSQNKPNAERRGWHTIQRLTLSLFHNLESPRGVTLPLELWTMIIDYVLDSLRPQVTYCKSRPFTQDGAQFSYIGDIGSNADWCSLRLVCHAWTQLAGPNRQLTVRDPNHHLHSRLTGIKYDHSKENHFEQLVKLPNISSRLTSLSLLENDSRPWFVTSTIDLFLSNAANFQMLRSLCLRMNPHSAGGPDFWERLARGYPLLIYLAVFDCRMPSEGVAFTKMETLIIGIESRFSIPSPEFYLPSLKNLAFIDFRKELRQILVDHGSQLKSLTFPYTCHWVPPGSIESNLWAQVPNLLILDISSHSVRLVPPLPIGHPLQRICIHSLPSNRERAEIIRLIFRKFPTISHLCFSETTLYKRTQEAMRHLARKHGAEFSAFPNPDPLERLPWYLYLFHRSYQLRRKSDILFFPFGVLLFVVVSIGCLLFWTIKYAYLDLAVWVHEKTRCSSRRHFLF